MISARSADRRKDEWLALFAPDAVVEDDDGQITSIGGHWEPDRAMATLAKL